MVATNANAASLRSSLLGLPSGRRLRAYVACVSAAGAVAVALSAYFGRGLGDVVLVAGLVIAGAASERWKIGLFGDAHVSLTAVVLMAAALLGGPRDVAIVAPLVAVSVNLGGVVPLYKTAFNVSVYMLASLAFLATVRLYGAGPLSNDWPQTALAATLGGAVYFSVNAGMVAVAVSIASSQRALDVFRTRYLWLLPYYLPMGAIAASLAHGYDPVGAWALVIFAAPVAGLQLALYQYSSLKRSNARRLSEVEERFRAVETELALARGIDASASAHSHVA